MPYVVKTSFGGIGRERIPEYLRGLGFMVQLINGDPDLMEMRCTRDKVSARLSIVRADKKRFDLQAEPEVGLMIFRGPAAIRLAEELVRLVQAMPLADDKVAVVAAPTETQWFIGRDGKRSGPFAFEKLQQMAAKGTLRRDDLVFESSRQKSAVPTAWQNADSVADLFPSAKGKPARSSTAKTPTTTSHSENVVGPPVWMFTAAIAILVATFLLPLLILSAGSSMADDTKLGVCAVIGLTGMIGLAVISHGILNKSRQPIKAMREVAIATFCVGVLFMAVCTIFRSTNDRGADAYLIRGPQSSFDLLAFVYGGAMVALGTVTFLLPNAIAMIVNGIGFIAGGLLQMSLGVMAMTGAIELRSLSSNGLGKLLDGFAAVPLVMGLFFVLGGIGMLCWSLLKDSDIATVD